jgi:hypothetical protein
MILPLLLVLTATFATPAPLSAETTAELSQNPETIAEYVHQYYADTPVLADIAWCESRNRQWNPDGTVFHGSVNHYDVGVMQVNSLYHEDKAKELGFDIYTLPGNLEYAKDLYSKEGTKPWASSQACWGKLSRK